MPDLRFDRRSFGGSDLALGKTNDLDFHRESTGGYNLSFGSQSPPSDTDIFVDVNLPEIAVDALISLPCDIDANVTLPEIVAENQLEYLVNVWRGPQLSAGLRHESGRLTRANFGADWQPPATFLIGVNLPACTAAPSLREQALNWDLSPAKPMFNAVRFDEAVPLRSIIGSDFQDGARAEAYYCSQWESTARIEVVAAASYAYPPRQACTPVVFWDSGESLKNIAALLYNPRPDRHRVYRVIPWSLAGSVVSLWPRSDPWEPPPPRPRIITPDLAFTCLATPEADLHFGIICGRRGGPVRIPVRRTYIVINDIEITRVADGFPIQAKSVSLSLDADSWAWGFSATLLGTSALDAVQPDELGEPVMLQIDINGYSWRVYAEEFTENREFGRRSISVSGRGLSAYLSAPYKLPGSGQADEQLLLQQIMAQHLPLDDSWTLNWTPGTPDWLIPAGAASWSNKTPIQAINEAAIDVGLVVVPAMDSKSLTVQPRYPVLPWHYATATPDITVPDAAIINVSRRQRKTTQANAVYVHGAEVGGVLARCYLSLTAGDRVAETRSSSLITDVDAARLLGSRTLAAEYEQPGVRSIVFPLGGEFALGEVGKLLRVEIDSSHSLGVINSVSVSAAVSGNGSISVRQSLTIGEESQNKWIKFKSILPSDPLLIGNVVLAHSDGSCTVSLPSGGTVRVRGSGSPGQTVYIRSGKIDGIAPSLTALEIEI